MIENKDEKFPCSYCGIVLIVNELELDHIVPKSKGGSSEGFNLTLSCRKCNSTKASKSVGEFMVKIGVKSYIKTPNGLADKIYKIRNAVFINSEYSSVIRISERKFRYLYSIKGKKSIAGKLDEIIDFWENNYENHVE